MQFIFILFVIYLLYVMFRKKNNSQNKNNNLLKIESPVPKKSQVPIQKVYETYVLNISINDEAEKFYKKNKIDDLEENDDYSLTKKELFDEVYSTDKIYKYLPLEIDCKIVDKKIYDDEGIYIGDIDDKDLYLLDGEYEAKLYFNEGSYKFVDYINEEIERVKGFSWFDLKIKKEMH